jgi:hypothetical protein
VIEQGENMTIKNILDFFEKMKSRTADEGDMCELTNYLGGRADEAQKVILENISERELCSVMSVVKAAVMASMILDGAGVGLVLEDAKGDLEGFVHTISLAMLGIAMDEEWL